MVAALQPAIMQPLAPESPTKRGSRALARQRWVTLAVTVAVIMGAWLIVSLRGGTSLTMPDSLRMHLSLTTSALASRAHTAAAGGSGSGTAVQVLDTDQQPGPSGSGADAASEEQEAEQEEKEVAAEEAALVAEAAEAKTEAEGVTGGKEEAEEGEEEGEEVEAAGEQGQPEVEQSAPAAGSTTAAAAAAEEGQEDKEGAAPAAAAAAPAAAAPAAEETAEDTAAGKPTSSDAQEGAEQQKEAQGSEDGKTAGGDGDSDSDTDVSSSSSGGAKSAGDSDASKASPAPAGSGGASGGGAGLQLENADEDEEEEESEEVLNGGSSSGGGGSAVSEALLKGPSPKDYPWWDVQRSVEDRVEELVKRMSPRQKVDQLQSATGNGIPELEVPTFNWQEECLHGVKVGRPGVNSKAGATIYPINIAWAATFDDNLAHTAASQIGDEMRAQYNRRARAGMPLAYSNCFGPHIHIVRDPRWGRLAETFGEDPLLQSNMAVAHVTGLQGGSGQDTYIKIYATCKHFIGNDLEGWQGITRHNFNNNMSASDLRDTFLPPFEACVREAHAQAFMCSYNSVNGQPSCVNKALLTDLLRGELGFDGMVVTDCTALTRMVKPQPEGPHLEGGDKRKVSARAVRAGTDMACHVFDSLVPADLTPKELNTAVRRVLRARIKQGHFNPISELPFGEIDDSRIGHEDHKETAVQIAAKGSVLLKNANSLLPLNPERLRRVAVIGPFADKPLYILGKYFGATAGEITTPLKAIKSALPGKKVLFNKDTALEWSEDNVEEDAQACESADVCVLFLGSRMSTKQSHWQTLKFSQHAYDRLIEGEGYDRTTLKLQADQVKLWKALAKSTTKPLVVVLTNGGPIDISDMHDSPRIGAILSAWHPGQHGSIAVADILFGKVAPSGRVPITWYKDSYTQQLSMADVRMRAKGDYPGRTYRYWRGEEPLYPFGYGLSYVQWKLQEPSVSTSGGGRNISVSVTVASQPTSMPADTSVLLFMSYLGPGTDGNGGGAGKAKGKGPAMKIILSDTGCSSEDTSSDLVQRLVGYQRTGQLPGGASKRLTFGLQLGGGSRSSWAGFGDPEPPCGAYTLRFGVGEEAQEVAAVVLA